MNMCDVNGLHKMHGTPWVDGPHFLTTNLTHPCSHVTMCVPSGPLSSLFTK